MEDKKKADLSPGELSKFRKVETAFLDRCRQFAYKEIKTSSIEPLYIFTGTNALSPEVLKRIYSFLDWGGWSGERVVLRPDLTISAVRYYLEHFFEHPHMKLCYVENFFLLDDTGRDVSERWQFGIENIGDASPVSDAEAIFIALDTLKSVGFDKTYLHLSYPSVVIECVNHTFSKPDERQEALKLIKERRFKAIESIDKNANVASLRTLLSFKGSNSSYIDNLRSNFKKSEKIQSLLTRFKDVCLLLDSLNYDYEINFSLSKDLEYYTGIHFQILSSPQKAKVEVLCSGGRYDNLISTLGNLDSEIPAVGFALYVKNLINIIPTPQDVLQNIGIIVRNVDYQNIRTGQTLCAKFSRLGFVSLISLTGIEESKFKDFGLIIEVDHDMFKDGYNVIYSHQIDKPLLKNIFGEFSFSE